MTATNNRNELPCRNRSYVCTVYAQVRAFIEPYIRVFIQMTETKQLGEKWNFSVYFFIKFL